MLEVIEDAKWTMSFNSMMGKHCAVCTKIQARSEQGNPAHRWSSPMDKPGQGSIACAPQHSSCKRRLSRDDKRPFLMDMCAYSLEHTWHKDNEEPEANESQHQTKSPSILSTDSGFEGKTTVEDFKSYFCLVNNNLKKITPIT